MANPAINDVLDSIVSAVAGLGLLYEGAPIAVSKRLLPQKEQEIDPATQIIVSLAPALPQPARFCVGMLLYQLPVEVTLVSPFRADYVTPIAGLGDYYARVRDLFSTTSRTAGTFPITIPAGPDTIWKVRAGDGAFLDRPRLAAGYNYQSQVVNVWLLSCTRDAPAVRASEVRGQRSESSEPLPR